MDKLGFLIVLSTAIRNCPTQSICRWFKSNR